MSDWRIRRAWLGALEEEACEEAKTALQMAISEARIFNQKRKDAVRVIPDSFCTEEGDFPTEGYALSRNGNTVEVRGGRTGILYGTYAAMEAVLCAEDHPEGIRTPRYPLRMLDAWDNMDGTIERGYAGRSIWFEGGSFSYDAARIRQLGRMLASVGINVLCINNVNVHPPAQGLGDVLLDQTAAFAALLRPFGVRLMLSVDFSLPMQRGLDTADPVSDEVTLWWERYAARLWGAIPDLAGFLVKADSEHRPGPNAYGRSHAQGANALSRAIAPYGGVLVWRAFVYNCEQDWRDMSTDRPCAAYDVYHPLDGAFDDNVILQIKYGPFDFQVREPLSPLFFCMKKTNLALELQLAQEYTGQQIDLFAMPSMWQEIFAGVGSGTIRAVSAVSNLGRDANWTGHPFAALNLYAFGRYAWNPDTDPEAVIRRWIRLTYRLEPEQEDMLARILLESRDVYELYTSTLGLCWMMRPETHYGPSPYGYEFDVWGTYNRADRSSVGVDRTGKGTGLTLQYPPESGKIYEDPEACPENLLLFFHRLPYTWRMRDGRSLIQRIYDDHFEGCSRAEQMQEKAALLDLPASDMEEVRQRMLLQVKNAREWRDVINTFFCRLSGIPDEKGRKIWP